MATPTPQEVIDQLLAQDKRLTGISNRFAKELVKLQKNFLSRFKAELRDPGLQGARQNFDFGHALKVMNALNEIMADAGMGDFVTDYVRQFPAITRNALSAYELYGEAPKLSNASKESLNAYIRFSESTLRKTLDRAMFQPIQSAIFQGTFGGQANYADVVQQIIDRGSSLPLYQVEVAVDDSFRQYQRAVTVEKAQELDIQIYWYTGAPPDAIISPQCEYILTKAPHGVPGMWYRDEISADMVPDVPMSADPLIAGGHPRCRHKFVGITLDFAIEQGFEPRESDKPQSTSEDSGQ